VNPFVLNKSCPTVYLKGQKIKQGKNPKKHDLWHIGGLKRMNRTDNMRPERPTIIGNIPKLPAKWATVVMPFILSGLMSGIISLINMLRNLGWSDGFMNLWFHNWMISWAFAFPIVLMLLPLVRKLTARLVDLSDSNGPK
jgi:hypothetical protein